MSTPTLSVAIEPSDGTSVLYEPVARNDHNSDALGIVCLRLVITNKGSSKIHLNKVKLSFSSPPNVAEKVISVPENWPGEYLDGDGKKQESDGVNIKPGGSFNWNSLRQFIDVKKKNWVNDAALLPANAPDSMTISLFFDDFSSPWKVTKKLAPHKNPVSGDAYQFPAHFDDLREGEFWQASSNTHGTGAEGSQLFGYDMGVFAFDPKSDPNRNHGLNSLLPDKDGSKNKHYRIWGKKVYAMADGTVVHFLDGVGTNPKPGKSSDGPWQEAPWDNAAKAWSDHVGAGNHFYIQHGDEVVLYAHMQEGTLNPKLLKLNAVVKAGDLLGLAGNAGSSSGPHLHIHSIKGTVAETGPLRPLLFHDMFAIDPGALSFPSIAGPWARVQRQGPPAVSSGALIWPLGRDPEWKGWQDLGGPITAPPAVASWGPHRLDVFAAGNDNQLNHKWWDGSIWHDWQTLGGNFKSAPATVSWGPHRIDVFVRGMDDHLGHLWWDGSKWQGWQDLGGPITSAPAVTSWGPDRLDVFAAGKDGQLKHKWWDGSIWHDWQNLGGVFKDWPAAVSWAPHRIDVFVRGMDDHLGHLWWDGSQWQGWQDLGTNLTSGPGVASWGAHRLDVFAARSGGELNHKWYNGSAWSGWDEVGGVFKGNPAAVSWGSKRIDVFVRGMDDHLAHLWRG